MPRIVFDLVGTLFTLDPVRQRLASAGAPVHALELWLAEAERDQLALALGGSWTPLENVLAASLPRVLAAGPRGGRDPSGQAQVLKGLSVLNPLEGARAALAKLESAGLLLAGMTLSSERLARELVERAGLGAPLETIYSGSPPEVLLPLAQEEETWLVTGRGSLLAVARSCGVRTAWIARREGALSAALPAPDLISSDLAQLVSQLTAGGARGAADAVPAA